MLGPIQSTTLTAIEVCYVLGVKLSSKKSFLGQSTMMLRKVLKSMEDRRVLVVLFGKFLATWCMGEIWFCGIGIDALVVSWGSHGLGLGEGFVRIFFLNGPNVLDIYICTSRHQLGVFSCIHLM